MGAVVHFGDVFQNEVSSLYCQQKMARWGKEYNYIPAVLGKYLIMILVLG